MWHRLALALGSTVTDLQERMPHREYVDWVALWQIEPWGDVRGDMQAALVATLLANAHRDRKKRQKPYDPADFMPRFWRRTQSAAHRTGSSLAAKALAIFSQMTDEEQPNE
jgi:hypothetical protein